VRPGKYIVTTASIVDEVDEAFTMTNTADGIADRVGRRRLLSRDGDSSVGGGDGGCCRM
jgi:hypothetical protein